MIKSTVSVLASLFIASTSTPVWPQDGPANALPSDEASKLVEARAIMAIKFPPAERNAKIMDLFGKLRTQFDSSIPANLTGVDDPGLSAIMEDYRSHVSQKTLAAISAHLPSIIDAIAVAYSHEFSFRDLKDIHAFGETPAGQRFLSSATEAESDPAFITAYTGLARDMGQDREGRARAFHGQVERLSRIASRRE